MRHGLSQGLDASNADLDHRNFIEMQRDGLQHTAAYLRSIICNSVSTGELYRRQN